MIEPTVSMDIEMMKGFKNILFGGEGLFLTTLKGPGKVCGVRSATRPRFAAAVPTNSASAGGWVAANDWCDR